jgi:hypothetical protein
MLRCAYVAAYLPKQQVYVAITSSSAAADNKLTMTLLPKAKQQPTDGTPCTRAEGTAAVQQYDRVVKQLHCSMTES